MFPANYKYKTKQAQSGAIKPTRKLRLDITASSFRWRAANAYDQLPLDIKNLNTLENFKRNAKSWVTRNTPLE